MKLLEVEGARAPVPHSWRRHCKPQRHGSRSICVAYWWQLPVRSQVGLRFSDHGAIQLTLIAELTTSSSELMEHSRQNRDELLVRMEHVFRSSSPCLIITSPVIIRYDQNFFAAAIMLLDCWPSFLLYSGP